MRQNTPRGTGHRQGGAPKAENKGASPSSSDLGRAVYPEGPTQEEVHRYLTNLPSARFKQELERKMQLSLGEIGVETKICEKLFSRGIDTVGQLLQCSKKELLQIPSFGEKVVEHLLERLNRIGIYKGMGPDVGDQS